MVSTPSPPDPLQTASTQSSMNRDTAISQQLMNMINQYTPDGSLVYNQSGNVFTPSKTGDTYWHNKKTGEYLSSDPFAKTRTNTTADQTTTTANNWRTGNNSPAGTGGSAAGIKNSERGVVSNGTGNPDDWAQVTGLYTPTYTATTTLSPEQQRIYDETNKSKYNLAKTASEQTAFLQKYLGKGLDTSGAPDQWKHLGKQYNADLGPDYATNVGDGYATSYAGADDFSADRQRVEDALWDRQAGTRAQNQEQLRSQLIASGLRPGTEGWNSEMARLSSSENDARLATIGAAGDEQARMVGMARDAAAFGNSSILSRMQAQNEASFNKKNLENSTRLTKANFQNQSRSQYLSELYAQRNQPLNEISALLAGSQVNSPSFVSTPTAQVGGVDYMGMVGDNYKSQVASSNAAMGGLFGLLSAPFSMFKASDRRLKKHIKRDGSASNGLPWYEFRYVTDPDDAPMRHGFMSDDVRKVAPRAVAVNENGFDVVNYALAMEAA